MILTAAHCVDPNYPNLTTLARYKINENGSKVLEYLPKAGKIINHPNFKSWGEDGVKVHDLSLIIMKENIGHLFLTPGISNRPLSLIGFGKLEDGSYKKFPRKINNLFSLPHKDDQRFWMTHEVFLQSDDENQDFRETFFKGNYMAIPVKNQKSACRGDSGSPVFNEEDGVLIGIISHGSEDCLNQPVFFATEVAPYINWIEEVVEQHL